MKQDQFPHQPAFACAKLDLFEGICPESGNYTGLLCGLFAKQSFPPSKTGLARNRLCDFLKKGSPKKGSQRDLEIAFAFLKDMAPPGSNRLRLKNFQVLTHRIPLYGAGA